MQRCLLFNTATYIEMLKCVKNRNPEVSGLTELNQSNKDLKTEKNFIFCFFQETQIHKNKFKIGNPVCPLMYAKSLNCDLLKAKFEKE